MIKLLSKLLDKEVLVAQLRAAVSLYELQPSDDHFRNIALISVLVALKESCDNQEIHALLEKLASDTIPFFSSSAN